MFNAIDKLRTKVDADKAITLNEACFILWAEQGICSAQYERFKDWAVTNGFGKRKLASTWKALFVGFLTLPIARV